MRVKETINRSGYFWLPSSPEKKISGTLKISDGGEMSLKIMGTLDGSASPSISLNRIVGKVEKDEYVTLDDCFYTVLPSPFHQVSSASLYIGKAFIGICLDEEESIPCNTFKFSVEGIDEWLGICGMRNVSCIPNSDVVITYTPIEDIVLCLGNGMELRIIFTYSCFNSQFPCEAKIAQKIFINISSTESRCLDDFINTAHKISTFLCFATDQTTCIENVTATFEGVCRDINGKKYDIPVGVYYPSLPFSKNFPVFNTERMLFKYMLIKDRLNDFITKWISAYEKIDSALNLYFSVRVGDHRYVESRFLALAQSLETYHRRTSSEKPMNSDDYKVLIQDILEHCPEGKKEWLERKLGNGNEFSLRDRIMKLIESFDRYPWNEKGLKKTTNDIVKTRNYYTHYDKSTSTNPLQGRDLLFVCYQMEALLQLHILLYIGFSKDEISLIVKNCTTLRQKIRPYCNDQWVAFRNNEPS